MIILKVIMGYEAIFDCVYSNAYIQMVETDNLFIMRLCPSASKIAKYVYIL